MELLPILLMAGVIVGMLFWPKRRKRTLAQQSEEYNREYYANKKPRRL